MDVIMVSTGVLGVAAAISVYGWDRSLRQLRDTREQLDIWKRAAKTSAEVNKMLSDDLSNLMAKEQARRAKLRAAAAKGKAVQMANAAAKKAGRDEAAKAAQAKTLAELGSTTMRSRAQVVAPVKAKRTKIKNAGAGAAAKTG